MIAQGVFLVQFAALMLAVGAIPFVPDSTPLPLLGLVLGAAMLAAAAPRVMRIALSAIARIPARLTRRPAAPAEGQSFALPTEPGIAGTARPRAPSRALSAIA